MKITHSFLLYGSVMYTSYKYKKNTELGRWKNEVTPKMDKQRLRGSSQKKYRILNN